MKFLLTALCSVFLLPLAVQAGSYSQDFSAATFPSGTAIVNGTTVVLNGGDTSKLNSSAPSNQKIFHWALNNKAMQLTGPLGAATASWRMPNLDPGLEVQGFDATFNAEVFRSSATATPGAGWSLNFGAVPTSGDGGGEGGFVMPHGITIAWDLFNSGGTDLPSIEVFCDGVSVGNFIHEAYSGGTFTLSNPVTGASTAAISYNATGPTVQTAMRLVSGWGSVTVTGNVGGPWTVDHVTVGAYTAPTANPASLLPAGSTLTVKTVRPGTASLSAKWSFPDVLTDPPLMDDGTFTLTNPATSLTTAPIAFNADSATVQAAMRPISGWTAVTVTGNAGGPWTVDHGEVGAYADPVSDASAFLPANSSLAVVRTVTGTASVNAKWTVAPRPYRPKVVNVHWDYDGLDVTYGGRTIFTNLPTPGFVPAIGDIFAFSARNESSNTMNFFLDDVVLSTTPLQELQTNGIVITEFMADNAGTLEDEDVDSPDWIEIYNGTNAAINLNGYRLTNAVGNNSMWTFPSVSLPSYTYKIIYASGKNRTVPTGLLHTNFTLQKEAGYLALIKPDGVTKASEFSYGQQYEDISYGEKGPAHTLGFLYPPSPGAKTSYSDFQAPAGPSEDVVWSRVGGLIPGSPATVVTIAAPLAPGSVIRYTTDNTEPNSGSTIYNPASPPASFTVTSTINLRARIFTANKLPGATSSRTFLQVDPSLWSNYNGSSLPFSTNVPIVVLESFGVPVDSFTGSNREYRYSYAVVIPVDPVTGRATITDPPEFQGRCGTHVRGESSAGFPQRQYAWELWDNQNNDKDASILGMPAESDWILYAPWSDKSLMRDVLTFGTMRKLRSDYMAARTKYCELLFNQTAGSAVTYASSYRGVYVIKEKLKINSERVDVAKLNALTSTSPNVTGGYIFRRDKADPDSTTWSTATYGQSLASYDPDLLTAPQLASLQGYFNNFEAALAGPNFANPTTGYAAWIETDTFIDAQWFVEWTKQVDGYVFSTYFHKDRNGKVRAGPIWDFNISIGNADYATGDSPTGWLYDTAGTATGTGGLWYPRLHDDPWYRLRHFDRYWELRRGLLATTSIMGDIDANANLLLNNIATPVTNSMPTLPPLQENAVMRHFRAYPRLGIRDWPNPAGTESRTTYQSEVDYMKTWLTTRLNWLDDQNYSGTVIYRPPNFSTYGGSVVANFPLTISGYTGTPPPGYTYATGGTLYYTLDGSDPYTAPDAAAESVLIAGNAAACKWLVPTAGNGGTALTAGAGAQQWTTYTDPPNIANWTTGTTGIGYDTNPDYLPLLGSNGNTGSQMNGINATCYLRLSFNIPNQAALNNIGSLKLSMKYDDGFRAYLNGTVIAGRNDTSASMTSNPATAQASTTHDDSLAVVFEEIDITAAGVPALRVGTNTLAIHCLNAPSTSSDFLMIPKLTSLPPGAATGGRRIYTEPFALGTSATVRSRLLANGYWSPITEANFIVNAVPASAANLVISELHYRPVTPSNAEITAGYNSANMFEYIELLNVSNQTVDLTGCKFTLGVTFDFADILPADLTLAAGQRVLLVGNKNAFLFRYGNNPGVKIIGEFAGNLSNSGERLIFLALNNGIIADFTYGGIEPWPVAANGSGYSLVLNNPAPSPTYGSGPSWRSSPQIGGSPGLANSTAFTGALNGDTDADGLKDYLEYGMGSSWTSSNSRADTTCEFIEDPPFAPLGTYLQFSYPRNLSADGVVYTAEMSTALTGWNAAGLVYLETVNNGNGTATVRYRSANPVEATTPRIFLRLVVSPP